MQKAKKLDMTQGNIYSLIFRFALPLCLGSVLQQLYSTVDALVIGNYCGTTSLAAVGTSSQPVELLLSIFLGMGVGVSILVAQLTGGNQPEKLRATVQNATTMLFLCAIPLTVLGVLLGPLILQLMQVPDDTMPYAVSYIRIMFLGTLFNMGYNIHAGILRGMGDSKSSLLFLMVSCVMNIVLDLLFVGVLCMDVSGAALATIIAQLFSYLVSGIYMRVRFP